jgi:hypothetical protein
MTYFKGLAKEAFAKTINVFYLALPNINPLLAF